MNRNDTGIDRNDTGMNRNGTGIDRNDTGMNRDDTGIDRNDTGMNRNDTGIDRNDTGMNRNDTGIDRNDKGIKCNIQMTLTATRVDQKHRKCVVHVIGNNMSHAHINRFSFFRERLASLLIFLQCRELCAVCSFLTHILIQLW